MSRVDVITGARLHFGLLCAPAGEPWHYGGIGMMIDSPGWQLRVSPASADEVVSPALPVSGNLPEATRRIAAILKACRRFWPKLPFVKVELLQQSPFHAGLGAGTQLTLAVASAAAVLAHARRGESLLPLAERLDRVRRSAVGTSGFERGGFLVDHGQPVTSSGTREIRRHSFPDDWRMLLITPISESGASGESEEAVFQKARTMSAELIATQAALIARKLLPAIQEQDFSTFRDALQEYGTAVGDYFSDDQGGVFSSSLLADIVRWLAQRGVTGAVQSSWGPTVCVPTESAEAAGKLPDLLSNAPHARLIQVRVVRGLNTGATIRTPAPELSDQRFFA